ncbi:MAG: ATPase, T2SS/T4P/T4SS family [Candidatus Njordarchaeota archaeon]
MKNSNLLKEFYKIPEKIIYENFVAKYVVDMRSNVYEFALRDSFINLADLVYPFFVKRITVLSKSGFLSIDKMVSIVGECVRKKSTLYDAFSRSIEQYDISMEDCIEILTYYYIYRLFGSDIFFPMIIDEFVNEIYIDGSRRTIYIDHSLAGRLDSRICLSKNRLKSFLSIIKIYGDVFLAGYRPSSKTEFKVGDQKIRISVDIGRDDNASIVIRRVVAVPPFFSLFVNKYMRFMLAIIFVLMALRPNLIIFGETGSGKTTLAGAILSGLPAYWRLILIEDIEEIPDILLSGKRVTRIRVPTFEAKVATSLYSNQFEISNYKNIEIIKLLHRSPDYIFVGEIQDYSDTYALFHSFSIGIRGLATTHSRSIEGLLNRWLNSYKLPQEWIDLIDMLVFTEKHTAKNFIFRGLKSIYFRIENDIAFSDVATLSQSQIKKVKFSGTEYKFFRIDLNDVKKFSIDILEHIERLFFVIFSINNGFNISDVNRRELAIRSSMVFMEVFDILTSLANIINKRIIEGMYSFTDFKRSVIDAVKQLAIRVSALSDFFNW